MIGQIDRSRLVGHCFIIDFKGVIISQSISDTDRKITWIPLFLIWAKIRKFDGWTIFGINFFSPYGEMLGFRPNFRFLDGEYKGQVHRDQVRVTRRCPGGLCERAGDDISQSQGGCMVKGPFRVQVVL